MLGSSNTALPMNVNINGTEWKGDYQTGKQYDNGASKAKPIQ